MNGFTYCNPVKVVFGLGTLAEAGVEAVKTVSFNADGVLASNPPVTAEMLAEILEGAL